MGITTLIGYYADKGEALHALEGLAAKVGGNGLVLIHKGADGETSQRRHSLFRRTPSFFFTAIICALLTATLPLAVHWFNSSSVNTFFGLPFYLSACTFVLLAGLVWLKQFKNFVNSATLTEHLDLLIPGESALILQASLDSLHTSVTFLDQRSDIPPSLFILHPRHERRSNPRTVGTLFAPAQIAEYAFHFARKQKIDPQLHSGVELLKRLKASSRWVKSACADLAAARQLEQKATLLADWGSVKP